MNGYICMVLAGLFHVIHVRLGLPEGIDQMILAQGPTMPQLYLPWRARH